MIRLPTGISSPREAVGVAASRRSARARGARSALRRPMPGDRAHDALADRAVSRIRAHSLVVQGARACPGRRRGSRPCRCRGSSAAAAMRSTSASSRPRPAADRAGQVDDRTASARPCSGRARAAPVARVETASARQFSTGEGWAVQPSTPIARPPPAARAASSAARGARPAAPCGRPEQRRRPHAHADRTERPGNARRRAPSARAARARRRASAPATSVPGMTTRELIGSRARDDVDRARAARAARCGHRDAAHRRRRHGAARVLSARKPSMSTTPGRP